MLGSQVLPPRRSFLGVVLSVPLRAVRFGSSRWAAITSPASTLMCSLPRTLGFARECPHQFGEFAIVCLAILVSCLCHLCATFVPLERRTPAARERAPVRARRHHSPPAPQPSGTAVHAPLYSCLTPTRLSFTKRRTGSSSGDPFTPLEQLMAVLPPRSGAEWDRHV